MWPFRYEPTRPGGRVDLTDSVDPTLALLANTHLWRQRLVETFTYRDSVHVRVTSSYQVELTPDFVAEFAPGATTVNVLVPITTRPKQPLLGFDVEVGSGDNGFVLPRSAGAEVELRHLSRLISSSPANAAALAGLSEPILRAICLFTQGTWLHFADAEPDEVTAITKYLADGLALEIGREHVQQWSAELAPLREILAGALSEPPAAISASENLLLALPAMSPAPHAIEDVHAIIQAYAASVHALAVAGDNELLALLAEYGRRWEMFVEAELPTDRPSRIRISEDRPAAVGDDGSVVALVALGDAASVHFEARVDDPNVVIENDFSVTDVLGGPVNVPTIESGRSTDETLSLYTSLPDRPYYVRVRFSLRPSAHLRAIGNGVFVVALSGILAAAVIDDSDLTGRLGLVLLPATFASAFVLAREQTPLAARLLARHRKRLAIAAVVLWLVALGRVLLEGTIVSALAEHAQPLWDASIERSRWGLQRAAQWIR